MNPQFPKPNFECQFLEHWKGFDLYYLPGVIPDLMAIGEDEVLSGFDKGASGEDEILAYAYGVAKTTGYHKDPAEQDFLINSAIGYLVRGTCGEYSDRREWPVFFTLNRTRAEQFRMAVQLQVDCWAKHNKYHDPPHGWSQLDPNMKCDFGAKYDLIPIKHESDPNRISFAMEICPECNSQVYDTPHGMICERGHTI